MIYNWNIEFIERVQKVTWPLIAVLSILYVTYYFATNRLILGFLFIFWGVRSAYAAKKKFSAIKDNLELAPHVLLQKDSIYYKEFANGYNVTIDFTNIESVKLTTFLGFSRLKLTLKENKTLSIWNISNSEELACKLQHVTS